MWFRVTPLLPSLQAHQLSKADSFLHLPCVARLHEQDRTQGSAPLKEMAQAFVAKSTEAAWAAWLQAEELTICTRSIQSNTQLSQQARFPGARGACAHSRGDLMYLLILRRSQFRPFSLLYSTLWKPTGLPHASQIVCFLHDLCKFCHHLCPEEHYQLGGCLKNRGRVCLVFHLLPQVVLHAQRGTCGWTGLAQTMFIHGVFETLYAWMESENSKSGVQPSFHGWKIHFSPQVEANTVTNLSEPS